MNEEIKNSIIEQIDKLSPLFKHDVALLIMSALYEKLPEWEKQKKECSTQIIENLLDFFESLKGGDEE